MLPKSVPQQWLNSPARFPLNQARLMSTEAAGRNLENTRPARAPQQRRRERPAYSPRRSYVRSEVWGMSGSQRSARSDGDVDGDTSASITLAGICRSRAHCEAAHPRRSVFERPGRHSSPDMGCRWRRVASLRSCPSPSVAVRGRSRSDRDVPGPWRVRPRSGRASRPFRHLLTGGARHGRTR